MDKYFKKIGIVQWIRMEHKPLKGISIIWNCLTRVFNIIGQQLASVVGDEHSIRVSLYPIMGGLDIYALFADLIHFLHNKGLYSFNQVETYLDSSCLGTVWMDPLELEFPEKHRIEWLTYIRGIYEVKT